MSSSSSAPQTTTIIPVPCPGCPGAKTFPLDTAGYHGGVEITPDLTCPEGHRVTGLALKGGKMTHAPSLIVQTDIQKFVDVPQAIRDIIEEANRCLAFDTPMAGACLVRTTLDLFLFELGFSDRFTGHKVEALEKECLSGKFPHLSPRISQFKSITGMTGKALHAPGSSKPLFTSEWLGHLNSVEGAIKQTWPKKVI